MPKKTSNRCWPGYEPVPGKPQHSQGSCKPKAESKLSSGEKTFRAKRKRQFDRWQEEHKAAPRKAAQQLAKPGTANKAKTAAVKKRAVKKAPAGKRAARKAA